ncbi:FkbM family methyltransferase [Rhodoblastus acidophilus]|uniref:FkbM family methyltransferase n=1 Tax=Candidatus Rhodoblastus alkanivorans TaxID=2954117 RepID=A0ABS9Z7I5_9HYPH|nr:FkbM family methyltransferase [Candidatus Rhodoblastus alkanivorans]MCI4680237.1 FkbM family methyltransferase [Candidatus Rhodoblastus alkanivorans]MCI4683340.1 FkbM family methyltransferase [Candidatus Rhodoblastus alkanivorans]MDI4640653.1 FkbM family methyltransferase [Rhodoblastus acidophilus]
MRAIPANDLSPFGQYRPQGALRGLLRFTQSAGAHWLGQRMALLVRRIGLRRLRARPVDVTVDTLKARMRLYPYNNACEKRLLFTPQFSDREERRFLAARISPDITFFDIGAGCGAGSLFVALRAGPRARVLAVEPQPLLFERLVYNLRQNPAATVKALDCAVADVDGPVTLFYHSRDLAETSMRIVSAENSGGSFLAPAKSLATLAREEGLRRIDVMKLDVEGAEDLALEPFLTNEPESLWPHALVLAYSPAKWEVDLLGLLESRGYVPVARTKVYVMYERGRRADG